MTLLHIIHTHLLIQSWDTRLFICTVLRMLFYNACSGGWRMTNIVILVNAWNAQWISMRCESHIVNYKIVCVCMECSVHARVCVRMQYSILYFMYGSHYNGLNHWWLLTMDESSSIISLSVHTHIHVWTQTFLSGAVAFNARFKLVNLRSFINNT